MVSAGDSHSAALSRDGRVFTWGVYKDSNGYIGHSPGLKKAAEPMEMGALKGTPIKWIASGVDHTFAVAANDFDVYSWGCGEQGQLGPLVTWQTDGKKKEDNQKHLMPSAPFQLRVHQDAPGLRSAAERLSYALNDNFRAFVSEELQADDAADLTEACEAYLEHRQAQLSGAADDRLRVRSVHCGAYHTLLLTHTENVYACGLNNMGQLGLGSLEPNFTKARTLTLPLPLALALTLALALALALTLILTLALTLTLILTLTLTSSPTAPRIPCWSRPSRARASSSSPAESTTR